MKIFIICFFLFKSLLLANSYPNKPLTFVVGFGQGGSADTMARTMAYFLEEELKTSIKVINIKENGSLDAAQHVLSQGEDGHTIFVSAFSPHLINSILTKKPSFSLKEFVPINLQWFDQEFIVVNKYSRFHSIQDVSDYIQKNPKKLKIGILKNSSGYLLTKLMFEKLNISFEHVIFKTFASGKDARLAMIESKIDLLSIAIHGCEDYRHELRPLAIFSKNRSHRWDAPTIHEVLQKNKSVFPDIKGSIRGFAVSAKFKEKYPKHFEILKRALRKTLARKKVQNHLQMNNIGYSWIGTMQSQQILKDSSQYLKKYHYLIED